jgi:hypothetical protein
MPNKHTVRTARLPGLAWNSPNDQIRQERVRLFERYRPALEAFGAAENNFEVAFDLGVTMPQFLASALGEWPSPDAWTLASVRRSLTDAMPSFAGLSPPLKDAIVEITTEAARLAALHRWQT